MHAAVSQANFERPAAGLGLCRLPVELPDAGERIVLQASGIQSCFLGRDIRSDAGARSRQDRHADNGRGIGHECAIAIGENPLDRESPAGGPAVDRRQIVERREESLELVLQGRLALLGRQPDGTDAAAAERGDEQVAVLVGRNPARGGQKRRGGRNVLSRSETATRDCRDGAYHKLGDVLGNPGVPNLGERSGPGASYDRARAIYQMVLAGSPTHVEARRALGRLLLTESHFYGLVGQADRAEDALAQSRAIWESLLQSASENEADLQGLAAAELAAYVRAGGPRSDAALPHIQQALAIFQRLYGAKPSDRDQIQNVALCHRYLVTFNLRLKEDRTALEHARLAAELDSRLVANAPHDAAARLDYSTDLSQMAVCSRRLGSFEEALRLYARSLAIRRALWESDRGNVHARDRLMYTLKEIGSLQADLGKWRDAQRHLLEAVEHASALHDKVSGTVPREILLQSYFHMGRVAIGLKNDPCPWFRRCISLAPVRPEALESYQYRVAVNTALAGAREGLRSCPQ